MCYLLCHQSQFDGIHDNIPLLIFLACLYEQIFDDFIQHNVNVVCFVVKLPCVILLFIAR